MGPSLAAAWLTQGLARHMLFLPRHSRRRAQSLERRGKNHLPPARAGLAQNIT
jgi:hypothetical protein